MYLIDRVAPGEFLDRFVGIRKFLYQSRDITTPV